MRYVQQVCTNILCVRNDYLSSMYAGALIDARCCCTVTFRWLLPGKRVFQLHSLRMASALSFQRRNPVLFYEQRETTASHLRRRKFRNTFIDF